MADYFPAHFKAALDRVDVDVAALWPALRDQVRPQGAVYEVIVQSQPDVKDFAYCLDLYSTCLHYTRCYPLKREAQHLFSVKQALTDHADGILVCLWSTFQYMSPFESRQLDPTLISASANFISAVFKVNDPWPDSNTDDQFIVDNTKKEIKRRLKDGPGAFEWLELLCLQTPVVEIVDHCFFFADNDDLRRRSKKTRELVHEISDPMDLDLNPSDKYYKALKVGPTRKRFDHLFTSNISADCMLPILQEFELGVSGKAPHPLWEKALISSIKVVSDFSSDCETISQNTFKEGVRLAHDIVKILVQQKFGTLRSHITEIVTKHQAAQVASSVILSAAKTFRWDGGKRGSDVSKYFQDRVLESIFLLPLLFEEMNSVKKWKAEELSFLHRLAKENASVWKPTLDSLRTLEASPDIHEDNAVFTYLRLWSHYGTLIGVQNVVDAIRGCCNADYLNTMVKTRKRSKKAATTENHTFSEPAEPSPSPKGINNSGLAIFPDELLLEIMSYYPALPLPSDSLSSYDIDLSVTRRELLLALSGTCSNLLNGRVLRGGGVSENKEINLELIRQLEIVTIRDPSLAEFVQ
ncbi:hypothetical protein NLJ89_g6419 [Agrocybe chaxingu]|uniref:Uncharacterized protein n=1 Tax=Agrocybe chaxingu TaxID=84603 RepID=A0A9W8JYC2_9AGAR|nr:hypothetical protein NLJ89_g6419 [Agrocybe chaxingu]